MACLVIALASCSDGGKRLYETAQFEEKQNNPEHAAELYEEIIEKYPESEFAAKARERLKDIKTR